MSDTDNQIPSNQNPLSIINKAGKLNYSIEQTVSIVLSHYPALSKNTLSDLIQDPGTPEYEAYRSGRNAGMFDVESGLYDAAAGGDADAQKALQTLRFERNVGDAIKNKFFPDTE